MHAMLSDRKEKVAQCLHTLRQRSKLERVLIDAATKVFLDDMKIDPAKLFTPDCKSGVSDRAPKNQPAMGDSPG